MKNLQAGISGLWEFVTVGEDGFSALWAERVKPIGDHLDEEQLRANLNYTLM